MRIMGILLLALCLTTAGCRSAESNHEDIRVNWRIDPDPPTTGWSTIEITLTDTTQQLISGAKVRLEGNMSHPGMQPIIVTAEEVSPGEYRAPIEFTMGGDWFILVESTLPDKRIVKRQINVSGVRSE
jgi:hypothetical protein